MLKKKKSKIDKMGKKKGKWEKMSYLCINVTNNTGM